MRYDAVIAEALRAILMEAAAAACQSHSAAKFAKPIEEHAWAASTALETGNAEALSMALDSIQGLIQSMALVRSRLVAPYAKAIQNALSTIAQQQIQTPKEFKMLKVTVELDITNKNTEFASEQAMLDWIFACLNCNTNNTEVKVAMASPDAEQADPRVLVTVSGGVAETYSDPGIDVAIFDWDNYNAEAAKTGGVPLRFEDLAIQANVPVEAESSSATDQPQG